MAEVVKKPPYLKTRLWINGFAALGIIVVYFTGITNEQWIALSGALLTVLNVLLSAFSGEVMEDDSGGEPK